MLVRGNKGGDSEGNTVTDSMVTAGVRRPLAYGAGNGA